LLKNRHQTTGLQVKAVLLVGARQARNVQRNLGRGKNSAILARMTNIRTALFVVGLIGLATPGLADQTDARLNPLFDRLKAAERPAEIGAIEQQIWSIWFETPDEQVSGLMVEGQRAMSRGDQMMALDVFDQVVDQAPDFAEGWNRRATLHYMLDNLEESLADIEVTLALEPRHFGALAGRGLVFIKLRQFEHALAAFEAALAVSPHMSGPRANVDALRELLGVRDI